MENNQSINNNLVVKSNYIIEASYRLSLQEQKLIYILTSRINKDDKEFRTCKLNQIEINNILRNHKMTFNELKQYIDNLRNRELVIITENSVLNTKWLSSAEYFNDKSIELCFENKLKPYLLELQNRFTKLSLKEIITFNSIYTCRIYELLKQYEKIKERPMSIESLRAMFGIKPEEYTRYNDFKRKVIEQAQKEINKNSDISFEIEEIKTGRKVTSIKFIISSNLKNKIESNSSNDREKQIPDKSNDTEKFVLDNIIAIFNEHITPLDAKKFYDASKGNIDLIKEKYELAKKQNVIDDIVAWMLAAIKNNYKQRRKIKQNNFNNFAQRVDDKRLTDIENNLLQKEIVTDLDDEWQEKFNKIVGR